MSIKTWFRDCFLTDEDRARLTMADLLSSRILGEVKLVAKPIALAFANGQIPSRSQKKELLLMVQLCFTIGILKENDFVSLGDIPGELPSEMRQFCILIGRQVVRVQYTIEGESTTGTDLGFLFDTTE